jgi:hypothetical protein
LKKFINKVCCEQRGLKSKKGLVLSAGVNSILAEFFGISDTEEGSIPNEVSSTSSKSGNTPSKISSIPNEVSSTSSKSGNTPSKISSIPTNSRSNTPTDAVSSIPSETLAVEVLPGKLQA